MQRITSLRETGVRATPSTGSYVPVSDYFLVDSKQDLRGRTLINGEGPQNVTVKDMLVDPDTNRVAMIELTDGRRIPIEHIRLRGNHVYLEQ